MSGHRKSEAHKGGSFPLWFQGCREEREQCYAINVEWGLAEAMLWKADGDTVPVYLREELLRVQSSKHEDFFVCATGV
jgi:hypothetical protein